jgi:ankyrin repeat protein
MTKTVILFVLFSLVFILPAHADINSDLIGAVEGGHTEILQTLLAKGANVNAKKKTGWTALIWAARKGHTATVQALLANGANVNAKTKDGVTALMWAAKGGYTEIVKALLAKGANVNAKSEDGDTKTKHREVSHTMRREVIIALGKIGTEKAIPKLLEPYWRTAPTLMRRQMMAGQL